MEFEEDMNLIGYQKNPNSIVRPSGKIQTSVLVSPEFFKLAKDHNIKFSEALKVGISILLSEKDVMDYDNRINIVRKMNSYKSELLETLKKIEVLESRNRQNGN